ncbi:LOW QUALITY PROTEIN: Gag-Pol polyprotein [Plecturocebus cupreus]
MLDGPKKAPAAPAILPTPKKNLELPPPYFRSSGQRSQQPSPDSTGASPCPLNRGPRIPLQTDSTGSQPLSPLDIRSRAPYPSRKKGAKLDRKPIKPSLEQGSSVEDHQEQINKIFPSTRPQWDPNTSAGLQVLNNFHRSHRLPSLSVYKTLIAPTLLLTLRPENKQTINLAFSAPDIKIKLQKLKGFQGINLTQLLKIAQKVFNNKDTSKAKQNKKVTKAVIAALQKTQIIPQGQGTPQGSPQGPQPRLGCNQCANGTITHFFLVIPKCLYPLLEQDLLHKLQANISFGECQTCLSIPPPLASGPPQQILITCALSNEYLLQEALSSEADQLPTSELLCQFQENVPGVWAKTNSPGLLLATATPVQVQQYPISQEARQGIAPHIIRLVKGGILTTCKSPWNTPLLSVLKPGTKDYRPQQDLRENAFFCIPLAPVSQPKFAFKWTNPDTGVSGQLTWIRLPQGFKNSPTLFNKAISQNLAAFQAKFTECTLL